MFFSYELASHILLLSMTVFDVSKINCSVIMNEPEKVVLDYSRDPVVVDKSFQTSVFSKIAEAGKIIESLYGYPQDIEGVVKNGLIYVVQARPQM